MFTFEEALWICVDSLRLKRLLKRDLSPAARKLCCTQSTVTFQIQQLEQELSYPVFEKVGADGAHTGWKITLPQYAS